ncbi:MAG: hypothetical protein KGL04_03875 [Elusimicrobia bacterium]|nr:hypothetical protein [Elusimicrobiota bacterium]MDE2313296.1 hypothetical protein [Elusimicrobiota bacterium]
MIRARLWAGAAAVLLCAACAGAPPAGLLRPVQRSILNLSLGESPGRVARDYPGLKSCPAKSELGGRVKRFDLSAKCVKAMPAGVREIRLGFDGLQGFLGGELAEIEIVYDADFTHKKPADALAGDVALVYGPPHHSQGKFWWADQDTVMRVFYAEVPDLSQGAGAVSLRTSFQLVDTRLFSR